MLQGLGSLLPAAKILVQPAAGVKRGPPRFLGKTKSQWLDKLMRSNANICALISLSFFPIVAYYSWRYVNVIKPAREAIAAKEREELLAEGKALA